MKRTQQKLTLQGVGLAWAAAFAQATFAATCPFDTGGSDAMNDGVVLTRYALGITGAPLTASTRYASLDPLQVKNNIECVGCALDINGDNQIDTVDTTIIARHLAGFSGASLTGGLALGAGSRNTTAAVTSFLANGCAVGGAINAFVQGGNAFGVPAVLGSTDGQPLTIRSSGASVSVVLAAGNGLRVMQGAGEIVDGPNVVNGSANNGAIGDAATVAGGGKGGDTCVDIATGLFNQSCGNYAQSGATVGGGIHNRATGVWAVVAGGTDNTASGVYSSIQGGADNVASGFGSAVPGGYNNQSSSIYSVAAGISNRSTGFTSFALGSGTVASGAVSFALGHNANTVHDHAFVWGGNPGGYTNSSGPSTFTAFAQNGYYFYGGTSAGKSCVYVPDNNNGWQCTSDRNAKTNIALLDGKSVLAKVVAMPVSSWSFIGGEAFRQIGPMAQDFFAAFKLGNDDKSISPMNMSGVALAAIQGLNSKLAQQLGVKDAEVARLRARAQTVERELAAIKKRLGM